MVVCIPCWQIIIASVGSAIIGGIAKEMTSVIIFKRRRYKRLKRKLDKDIKELNYNSFKNTIYFIRHTDLDNGTDFWDNIKKEYHIAENILEKNGKVIFDAKFNPVWDYDYQREEISKIVKELSMSYGPNKGPERDWD